MGKEITGCSHEIKLYSLEKRDEVIKQMKRCLNRHKDEFDAFAIQGYSSSMVAPILAHLMKKNIVLVRKPSEDRHSSYKAEGMHGQRCVWVDDLISMGQTFGRVVDGLDRIDCTVVGFALYESWESWYEGWFDSDDKHIPYWGIPKKRK